MTLRITLSEDDLKSAVIQYLQRQGYKDVKGVRFDREGYPDSIDPREQAVSYTASATVSK